MDIILYTTGCPLCKNLESKLNEKNLTYSICVNKDEMRKLGITRVPMLSVNKNIYNYKESLLWVESI